MKMRLSLLLAPASPLAAEAILHGPLAIDIDFGTNAGMPLKQKGRVLVGSAAAGRAIEGHHICRGMLALSGLYLTWNTIGA